MADGDPVAAACLLLFILACWIMMVGALLATPTLIVLHFLGAV